MMSRAVIVAISIFVCAVAAPPARAEWPDRAIRWVVPFGPGGANDLIARVAADAVSKRLGQPVIIENRPGAGAVVGTAAVAKSAGDGHTFLISAAGVITNSLLLKNLPYADSELVPVGMIAVAPSIIAVHPSIPCEQYGRVRRLGKGSRRQGRQLGHRRCRQYAAFRRRDDQGVDRYLA